MDQAHAFCSLAPCARHGKQPSRELLVGECVVAQHVALAIAAHAEHRTLMVSENRRGERRFPPSDQDVERAVADSDNHARQSRTPVEHDLEISELEGGPHAAVEPRHVGQEPGLALEIGNDEPFES
jgi:hypothetical protein